MPADSMCAEELLPGLQTTVLLHSSHGRESKIWLLFLLVKTLIPA